MNYWEDIDRGVLHIQVAGSMTLCGILVGWSRNGDYPVKEKWGCTCLDCQEELKELRTIKK